MDEIVMLVKLLKSKLYRARVTGTKLDYPEIYYYHYSFRTFYT